MKNVAVILAGGCGKRLGAPIPKQFLLIEGKTIIERSIEAFESHGRISEICIIIHADFVDEIKTIVNQAKFQKVKHILKGGKERSDSSLAAINAYQNRNNVNLIFHDAVRPFVSNKIISSVVDEVEKGKSVAVAIPSVDTIFQINALKQIVSVPQRSFLQRAQTPQAFSYSTIKNAYNIALKDPSFIATDDCGVVLKYLPNETIFIVDGDESNIKITYEKDIELGKLILNSN